MITEETIMNKKDGHIVHSKEYSRMMQFHREQLNALNKETAPWDYCFSLDYLIAHLEWMRDYYKLGENVWGMEVKDEGLKCYKNHPTRLESIEKALYYYNKWQTVEEEYVKVIEHPETKQMQENEDGTVTVIDLGFHCEYKYGPRNNEHKAMKITYKKVKRAQEKYKKLFYKTLSKYMEEWWD